MGRQAFRRRKSDGTVDDGTGGGANTDGAGFKFPTSNRVPMMNGAASNITTAPSMNAYWAYGNLVSFLENKTLDKAWIYINTLASGSAGTGLTAALYELADSVLTDSSPNGTLIATATWAASKFVTSSGSTGYNSEDWTVASGQSLTLDSSKYYAILTSNWANNQNSGSTNFQVLGWTGTGIPNITGSGGNVGVSNGFAMWVNGSTSPATSVSFSGSGSGNKTAVWSTLT
jgi:hypothetical protein